MNLPSFNCSSSWAFEDGYESPGETCADISDVTISPISIHPVPELIHKSARTAIYRLGDRGVKTPIDNNNSYHSLPTRAQIQSLSHEQSISNFLPDSCSKREVIDIQPFDGHPVALHFKWANGITVKEWIHNAQNGSALAAFSPNFTGTLGTIRNRQSFNDAHYTLLENTSDYWNNALSLTFTPGSSSRFTNRPLVDLNVRLCAAMAIAQTLSDFHEGGVAYNCLTPDNIVLGTYEGKYVATFIDLSDTVVFGEINSAGRGELYNVDVYIKKQMIERDLKNLGEVLNLLFCGYGSSNFESITTDSNNSIPDADDAQEEEKEDAPSSAWREASRRKRGKQAFVCEDLPFYLNSLISALILRRDFTNPSPSVTSSSVHYDSAKEVYRDLNVMSMNQKFFQSGELDQSTMESRLKLQSDIFYGRQIELSILTHLTQRLFLEQKQPLMAMISGYPGTGKSTLVNQIKKRILSQDGYFIEGKFDYFTRPDIVLASSLNSFFGAVIKGGPNSDSKYMSMRSRIHDAINSGHNLLMEAIPNLQKLMIEGTTGVVSDSNGVNSTSQVGKMSESSHRLKFFLCKLISAIWCKDHPLCLFLDDLHCADAITLDVIRMIMTDPDAHHFLFIGTFRENEVSLTHPLTDKLNELKGQGVNYVSIKVGPIEKECVNTLISEALYLPPSLCRPFSSVVHSKTGGIIMYVLQFLKSLNDDGLLWFSMSTRRWEFNLDAIRTKAISDDVVQHMTLHMTRLDKKMQMGLMMAACLGSSFDSEVLEKSKKKDDFETNIFLEKCVDDGFLILNLNNEHYTWSHDQVHQAAYEFIPLSRRETFHLLIGSRLLMRLSPSEMDTMLFLVVDNLNRGMKLIQNPEQKCDLSYLNLQAGEKAKYFMTGLSLLENNSWEKNYSLTIKLYDAASEALYVTGDFSRLMSLIDKPLKFAKCFEDKLNVYNNLVRALAAPGHFEEGINHCVSVLAQLEELIPTSITTEIYEHEVHQIKDLLHGKTSDQFLSLPVMTNSNKLAAMQFLNHLLPQVYITKPAMAPIISFRMIKLSIEYGVCNLTPFAFGVYAAWLISEPNSDYEGGYCMGRVATELMKNINAIEMIPRLYTTIYGMINIWKEPFQACLCKHLEAYEIGAPIGDTEFAISNLYQYANMAFYGCGEDLVGLTKKVNGYAKRAFQCQQHVVGKCFTVLHQMAFDFMGIDENAFNLYSYFSVMTEESCFENARRNNQSSVCRYICQKRKHVAFWTGNMDVAVEMYELSKQFPMGSNARLVNILISTFIDGLIALYFARKHEEDEDKWTSVGEEVMSKLQQWEELSNWNFTNKRYLLEAEYHFLKKNDEKALPCYEASIEAAHQHRFYHEEGLANEKAATYLLHKTNYVRALECFVNAKQCYQLWGAHALVHRVERAISILVPLCNGTR